VPSIPPIPAELLTGLSEDGRRFTVQMWVEFAGWTAADQRLLRLAAECHDRLAEARLAIQRGGPILVSRSKSYPNPWLRVERDTNHTLLAVMKELNVGRGHAQ
jgi:hypothetical protein